MLTVQKIKEMATNVKEYSNYPGRFILDPPVKLICKFNLEKIKKEEIVYADEVDENCIYSNAVHLKEKGGLWWSIERFELKS
jgi:hypothetical protein